jgi:phage repressor protein C with HTH and peptisase S24 domain
MQTPISKILAELMNQRGTKQVELSFATGVRQSTISRILRPDAPKGIRCPSDSQVKPIADFFKVTTDQLRGHAPLTQQERVIVDGLELLNRPPAVGDGTSLEADEVYVPLYSEVENAASNGSTVIQKMTDTTVRISRETLAQAGVRPANAIAAIARGNSMARIITDGSMVGIDQGTVSITDGEIYAIDHAGMLRIKYLYRMPGGGLRIKSENSEEHPDEIIPPNEMKSLKVLGWVFWWSTVRRRRDAPQDRKPIDLDKSSA